MNAERVSHTCINAPVCRIIQIKRKYFICCGFSTAPLEHLSDTVYDSPTKHERTGIPRLMGETSGSVSLNHKISIFKCTCMHMYEPVITVTTQYGSTELKDAKCHPSLGKLFTDLLSWKDEGYMQQNLIKKLGKVCNRKHEEYQGKRSGENEGNRRQASGSVKGGEHRASSA